MEKKNWREDMQCHVLLTMPDGMHMGLWVPKDETPSEYIKRFTDGWYKASNKDPKKYGHTILEERCPKCGELLHTKAYKDVQYCWCPSCRYQEEREKDGK